MTGRRLTAGLLLTAGWLAACGVSLPPADVVRVTGSDTMLVLMRRLAVGYMTRHPETAIEVAGGGTSVGVEALLAGDADLCAASRPLAADEVQRMFDRHGTIGARVVIAQDALSVWVHPANPVRNLSIGELRGLYSGELASWADVGGEARPVVTVVRPPSSGTYRFFRDHVLRESGYAAAAVTVPTTSAVVAAVAADPAAIGYGGVAYASSRVVAVAVDGVAPSFETVRSGAYPLSRFLHLDSLAPAAGAAKAFLDFCLSAEGQRIVAEVGYVPAWER